MQISARLTHQEEARCHRVLIATKVRRYQLTRLLVLLALDHVAGGADPFRPGAKTRLEQMLESLADRFDAAAERGRARGFNQALEQLEARGWPRAFSEVLIVDSAEKVRTKRAMVNARRRFLSLLETLPHDAPDAN